MNQPNDRKVKAQTMGSIMRHPKLSRTFTEAVSAPIGSTKRKQAQSMLAVMNKVNQRNMPQMPMMNGMGGPGFIGPMPQATATPTMTPAPKVPPQNKLLFNAAPLPASTIGQYRPPAPPDNVGLGAVVSEIPGTSKSIFKAAMKVPAAIGKQGANFAGGMMALPLLAGSVLESGISSAPKLWGGWNEGELTNPTETNSWKLAKSFTVDAPWRQPSEQFKTPGQVIGAQPGQQPQGTAVQGPQQQPDGAEPVAPAVDTTPGVAPEAPKIAGTQGTDRVGVEQTGAGVSTGSTPETQGGIKDVQDAISKNMGPAAFAFNAMGDKELLKRLFPGMPEDQLPVGASLSQQLASLQDLVRKDLNIDMIENSLANKIKTGVTLKDDLNAYIRGRDEMINNIDGMITDLQGKLTADNMRDPSTADTLKQYGNYLYTLKGRAAQRYTDFANTSINQFSNELTGLSSLYENKIKEFETVYNQRATMTQETYNRTYAMLTDLYNNIEQAPTKELNMAILRNQLVASNQVIADAATGAAGFGAENYSGDEYMKTAGFYEKIMTDPDTKGLAYNVSLDDFIGQAVNANLPINAAVDTFTNKITAELERTASDPVKFAKTLKYAKENLSGPILNAIAQKYPNSSATNAISSIYGKINNSVASHILANNDVYREALSNITSGGWFGRNRKLRDKEDWLEENAGAPQENLSNMYDAIKRNIEAGIPTGGSVSASPALKGLDEVLKQPDNEFASYISNYLTPFGQ